MVVCVSVYGPVKLTSCTLDSLVRISLAWKRKEHNIKPPRDI